LEGLLELSLLADQLTLRSPHEKVRRQKVRQAEQARARREEDDQPEEPLVIRYGGRNRKAAAAGEEGHRQPSRTGSAGPRRPPAPNGDRVRPKQRAGAVRRPRR